ncbi:response regulator 22 [Hibiscus trionum]|uniref:Response regulator 22 n=1 Tax=Hibiscus trionum TaxID=183268 RepID=A0A9W7HWT2_HIBTR|nr:response regulator 22 [Hibiscus trionum]
MVLGNDASSSSSSMISDEEMVNNNKSLSVLVVDDDPLLRMFHDTYLRHFGLESQVVENGKKAVDLFRLGASFNLILMDKDMPVMNGVEATKALRAIGVTSMIVGLTSRVPPCEIQAFMAAGLDYCFEKPLASDVVDFLLKELNKNNNNGNNV